MIRLRQHQRVAPQSEKRNFEVEILNLKYWFEYISPRNRYLDFAMEQNSIRVQDIRTVVENVARNPVGSLLVWRQLQTRWSMIESTFGRATFTIGRLIVAAVSHFHDPLDLKSVQTFFRNVNVGSGRRSLLQSLEMIQSNINFLDKYEDELVRWLNSSSPQCWRTFK